ncbi:MAG: hypothetical protein ACFFAO_02960 [Candidatus Hermodarchaeota archaeon]
MKNHHYKFIILITIILIISVSSLILIQLSLNHSNNNINNKKNIIISDKNQNNNTSTNLNTADNPGNFSLTADKYLVYVNGNITFFWSKSEGAENYSLYVSSKNITKIDGNCTLIIGGLFRLNYSLIINDIDLDYYVTVAYNESGNTLSNCVKITILEHDDGGGGGDGVLGGELLSGGLIIFFFIGIVFLLSISAIVSYREKRRNILTAPQEPFIYVEKEESKKQDSFLDEDFQDNKKPKSARRILNELINNENLIDSINQEKDLEKFKLNSISEDFFYKVDKFRWINENQKVEFIKEMLALTPTERNHIINYMMEKSKKEDLSI